MQHFVCTAQHAFLRNTCTSNTNGKEGDGVGIDVGVNLARFAVKTQPSMGGTLNTNRKTSFHTGLLVDIPVSGIFHLVPEVICSRQGSKIARSTGGVMVNYEESLDYLYLAPAVFKLMFPSSFLIQGGPQLGFLLNAKQEGPAPYNTDIKNNRKATDFLLSGGVGYMSPIGLGAHVRYNYGLSNVLNRDNTQNTGRLENRLIQLGLMYHFGAHR